MPVISHADSASPTFVLRRRLHETTAIRLVLASCAVGLITMVGSGAMATNECTGGATPAPGALITCVAGVYPAGIVYAVPDLTVTLDPGVSVTGAQGIRLGDSGPAQSTFGTQTLTASSSPSINVTTGLGIAVFSASGNVTVAGGTISTSDAFGYGIHVNANGPAGTATVTNSSTITTLGNVGRGIFTLSTLGGTIDNSGAINTSGFDGRGIDAEAFGGALTVINRATGIITTQGDQAAGIWVPGVGVGAGPASTIVTNSANITTNGGAAASAIRITLNEPLNTGSATINQNAGVITTNGQITSAAIIVGTNGPGTAIINMNGGTVLNNSLNQDSHGLTAQAQGTGDASVFFRAGSITTHGGIGAVAWNAGLGTGNITLISAPGTIVNAIGSTSNSNGLAALGGSAAAGTSVLLNSQSVITATNLGLDAQSQFGAPLTVTQSGGSITAGNVGISAATAGAISITNNDAIRVSNAEARGIRAISTGGATVVSHFGSILAPGEFAEGINALGNTSTVTIGGGATVAGGWQAAAASVGLSGLPSVGVAIGSNGGGASLANNGQIGALSDRAIAELDRYGFGAAGPLSIINNGNVTGFIQLGAGDAVFRNLTPTSFDMRHFADTNGDGIRDTKRVAISDFGAGNDLFLNEANGVVRLAPIAAAAATDPAGYYLPTTGIGSRPLEASFYDFTRPGLLQGQIVNLERFSNAGVIDLRGAVTGNTLFITGGAGVVGGVPQPGNGVYVSNGGQLLLNTVLNSGIPLGGQTNSYSDMLVVDSTQTGPGGATRILVTVDPASAGAITPGNGIALVEVRNKTTSVGDAFVLGGRVASGAFEYLLYHNGVGGDAADGNWYLRNLIEPPSPTPTPPSPPTPVLPNYRVEVPVDMVVPALASRLGLAMLGNYHDRVGEDYPDALPQPAPAAPIWCKDPARNFRCVPTAQQNAAYADAATGEGGRRFAGWGRVFGGTGSVGYGSRGGQFGLLGKFYRNGPSYDYDLGGFQTGMDLYRKQYDTGMRDIAGFFVGFGRIEGDVRAVYGGKAGSTSMDGYSVGAYWTRKGASGWYVDAVVQATWYDQVRARSVFGETLSTDGWGFAASLEGGYPIALGAGWTIEPQGQLIYQRISIDDGADRFGRISYDGIDTLYGRLGGRLAKTWTLDSGRPITTWARANVWHSFGADAKTSFASLQGLNPVALGTSLGGTWGQVGLGVASQLTNNVSLFATADYNFALDRAGGQVWVAVPVSRSCGSCEAA